MKKLKRILLMLFLVVMFLGNFQYAYSLTDVYNTGIKVAEQEDEALNKLYDEALKCNELANSEALTDNFKREMDKIFSQDMLYGDNVVEKMTDAIEYAKNYLNECTWYNIGLNGDTNWEENNAIKKYADKYLEIMQSTLEKKQREQEEEPKTDNPKDKFDYHYGLYTEKYGNKDFSKMSLEERKEAKNYLTSTEATLLGLARKINDDAYWEKYNKINKKLTEVSNLIGIEEESISKEIRIYKQPDKTGKSNGSTSADRLDQIIEGADDFVSDGNLDGTLSSQDFKSTFADIYNIFLQIGVGVSVIVGLILGIKFMLSGIEEKAEVKKMLVVYVVACVVIFGSFGIWKLLLNILQQM